MSATGRSTTAALWRSTAPFQGAVAVNSTGTLQGTSTVGGLVTVASGGTISPGNSAGTLTVGSLVLNSGSQTKIELGGLTRGTLYDAIVSSGSVSLGGTLNVSFINPFHPLLGDKFDILDGGPLSGTFSALQFQSLGGSLLWNVSSLETTGVVSVVDLNRLPGDFNRDLQVTAADIPVMLQALTDVAGYELSYGVGAADFAIIADVDESGSVNNGDIQGLLNELIHGARFIPGSPLVPVPEPASWALASLAFLAVLCGRRKRKSSLGKENDCP